MFFPILGKSQCACADIKFDLKLKRLKFEQGTSNYSMKILKPNHLKTESYVFIKERRIDEDNFNFWFSTGGGIKVLERLTKTLSVIIKK